jgi:hypothetical protein
MTEILLELEGLQATIRNGVWFCENKMIARAMNAMAINTVGYYPDITVHLANRATEQGWTIVKVIEPPEEYVDGRIY